MNGVGGQEFTVAELAAAVGDLAAAMADLEALVHAGTPGPPAAAEPHAWVDRATPEDWSELATWVNWLVTTYDLINSETVRPCWPAHRGVSEELAALRSAWRYAAARTSDAAPSEDLITWHERFLHPTLARLRSGYQQKACTETTHARTRPARTVDWSLLEAASGSTTTPPGPPPG